MRDVLASQKRPARAAEHFGQPAVVVLGGFKGGPLPADVLELLSAQESLLVFPQAEDLVALTPLVEGASPDVEFFHLPLVFMSR